MKMKNSVIVTGLLACLLFISGCGKKNSNKDAIITERIQYDVSIKSPDPDYDWWVQNIEGARREGMLSDILGSVTTGKVKAYDFVSSSLLSAGEVKSILEHSDTVAVERANPPHELVDTVIVHKISMKDITRLRFMEEWQMDHTSLAFSKKVIGICPMVEVFTETGELRGYKPLFWVFFDEQYPAKLK